MTTGDTMVIDEAIACETNALIDSSCGSYYGTGARYGNDDDSNAAELESVRGLLAENLLIRRISD